MTIHGPGTQLLMTEINAEFSLGNDLNAYRGVPWWTDAGASGNFSVSNLGFYEFYSKRKNAPNISLVGNTTLVSAGSNASINIPINGLTGGSDSAPAAGDLVIVSIGWASTTDGNPTVTAPGNTQIANLYFNTTADPNLGVCYFFATAGMTSITVSGVGLASSATVVGVTVLRGVNTTTPMDATPVTATAGSLSADAPPITCNTAGAWVLAIYLGSANANPGAAWTTPSGGFSALINNWTTTGSPYNASLAVFLSTAGGTVNPGANSNPALGMSKGHCVCVMAVRKA
jgi:hypothetical protein